MNNEPKTPPTPGPWSIMEQNVRAHNYAGHEMWEAPVQVGDPRVNGIGAGNVLATVCMGGNGATSAAKDVVLANALLIAAAPDLLEACKLAAGKCVTCQGNGEISYYAAGVPTTSDCHRCRGLRAAIQRATGGTANGS